MLLYSYKLYSYSRKNMSTIIRNKLNEKEIIKPVPIDEEIPFDGGVMITETDTAGVITYANRKFRELTGYTKEELIGSPHSINRHPDMPKIAFKNLWKTIKKGEYWDGMVKNMSKDGKYYLVHVWIKPKLDKDNTIIGYIAGRTIPNKNEMEEMLETYKLLLAKEHTN